MSITVSTKVSLDGDTAVTHVCAFAEVDARRGVEPREKVVGYISLAGLDIDGTAEDLRQLGKAIEDAAMEMERRDADARQAYANRADHYAGMDAALEDEKAVQSA